VWSAPYAEALTNGSRAIDDCEPCQAGNRAALSDMFDVPRGRLFRADAAVNACISISKVGVWSYYAAC